MGVKSVTRKVTAFPNGTTKTETTETKAFDWKSSAWLLERCRPEQFSVKNKKEIEEAISQALDKAIRDGRIKGKDDAGTAEKGKESEVELPEGAPDPESI